MNRGTRGMAATRRFLADAGEPLLIGVAVVCTAVVLMRNPHGVVGVVLVGIGTAAATWVGTRRTTQLPTAMPWAAMMLLGVIAVALVPIGSHDMWAYASYGRLVEHYHANPYHAVVAQFPGDPVFRLVGGTWQHTPNAYGPLFTGVSAIVSRLAGTNLLLVRLGFQVPAAIAMFASVWIAARTAKRRAVVVLVGLQPMVWISVVNGAHADVYIALGAVVAVTLLARDQIIGAAIAIGLAALVKVSALFAAPVIIAVLVARGRRREAFQFASVVGGCMAISLLVAPSSLTSAASATHGIISRASPWRLFVLTHVVSSGTASVLGLVAAVAIVAEIARRSRDTDVAVAVALALATYAIVAGFTLPWYAVWSMPVAAMSSRRPVAALVALQGAAVLAAYQAGSTVSGGLVTTIVPILTVAALLVLVVHRPGAARLGLRRVDVDATPGQLGSELVQRRQRRVGSRRVGRRNREHERLDDDERDTVAREEARSSTPAAQAGVHALGGSASVVSDEDHRRAEI